MIDNLDALIALAEFGTMRRAAIRLHITQGAVSKRIAFLEGQCGQPMVQKKGRNIQLTPFALRLLDRARPVVRQYKELFHDEVAVASGIIRIDVAASILIPWAAKALAKVSKEIPNIEIDLNVNHSSIAVERVRSGESMVALVQGESKIAPDLLARPIYRQEMVVIPSDLKTFKFPRSGKLELLVIEAHTEAWKFITSDLQRGRSIWGVDVTPKKHLQNFSAIVQMARYGFGHGLAPLDLALALGIPKKSLLKFPAPGIAVPVSLIARRSTHELQVVRSLYDALLKLV